MKSPNGPQAKMDDRISSCPRMLTPGGSRAWPNQKVVEVATVEDLAELLRASGKRDISDINPRPETSPQTPPDVLARAEDDSLVGIEVTELTDGKLIADNIPRSRKRHEAVKKARSAKERWDAMASAGEQVRLWSADDMDREIRERIAQKDAKDFVCDDPRQHFTERWLLIFSNESFMEWGDFVAGPAGKSFGPLRQFTHVWLLYYDVPETVYSSLLLA